MYALKNERNRGNEKERVVVVVVFFALGCSFFHFAVVVFSCRNAAVLPFLLFVPTSFHLGESTEKKIDIRDQVNVVCVCVCMCVSGGWALLMRCCLKPFFLVLLGFCWSSLAQFFFFNR